MYVILEVDQHLSGTQKKESDRTMKELREKYRAQIKTRSEQAHIIEDQIETLSMLQELLRNEIPPYGPTHSATDDNLKDFIAKRELRRGHPSIQGEWVRGNEEER
jgi:hypothetical protein